MSRTDFLERHQKPNDKQRTQVIDIFVKKAGDKLADVVSEAEEIYRGGKTFERSLADALEKFKLK